MEACPLQRPLNVLSVLRNLADIFTKHRTNNSDINFPITKSPHGKKGAIHCGDKDTSKGKCLVGNV